MTKYQPVNIFELFKQAVLSKDIIEARRLYPLVNSNYISEPTYWYYRGLIDYWEEKLDDAIYNLQELQKLESNHAEGMNILGLIYIQRNQYDNAISCLLNFNDAASKHKIGICYYSIGEYGPAILALEGIRSIFDVRLMLGKAYKEVGLYDKAELLLSSIISDKSENCHFATMWLGELLIEQKRFKELMDKMIPLLEHPHTNIAARSSMSEAYQIFDDLKSAALLLPSAIKTNWGHAFSMQVNTCLKNLLTDANLNKIKRRPHPYPDTNIGVSCSSLNRAGRLAHSMMDYLALRFYADPYGLPVETPDWPGQYLFEIDDPLYTKPRKSVIRNGEWLEGKINSDGILSILGCDFYSIGGLIRELNSAHVIKAKQIFKFREYWLDLLNPLTEKLRTKGKTIVSIHIRMTDMAGMNIPIEEYFKLLDLIIPTLDDPIIYLASDELQSMKQIFKKYKIISLDDLTNPLESLEWLQDFFILMNSDMAISSAGGFCRVANMLNTKGKIFYRPDHTNKILMEYDPLTSP